MGSKRLFRWRVNQLEARKLIGTDREYCPVKLDHQRIRSLTLQQAGLFEKAAEILFARDMFHAFFAVEAGERFIFHFEPLQTDDADVFLVFLPDLTLTEFHASVRSGRGSLLI
jgi:hypothetical protein